MSEVAEEKKDTKDGRTLGKVKVAEVKKGEISGRKLGKAKTFVMEEETNKMLLLMLRDVETCGRKARKHKILLLMETCGR